VRGSGPEGRFSATLLVAFERPDKLRVELLAPFGGSRWLAVVRGEEVTVLFPSRREFLRQAAVSEVLAALVGVRWEAGEVMAVLSGSGVPLGGAPPTCAFQEGETLRLEFGLDDGATQSLRLRGAQVIEASTPEYRVRYPTAWTSRRRSAPDRIEVGDEKLAASLVVSDLDINVSMDPELFRLEIPPGTSRVEVREIEGEAFFVKSAR
jgi:outer membrane lipoprotein-sorting protein